MIKKPIISLLGITTVLGQNVLKAADIAKPFGKTGEDVTRTNGVTKLYRFKQGFTVVDAATSAVKQLLFGKELHTSEIRGIFGSSNFTSATLMPTFTSTVAHKAGLRDVVSDHIGLGCAGGMQAFRNLFNQMVVDASRGRYGYYLLVTGDEVRHIINPQDYNTNIFFSEGACAALFSNFPDERGAAYTVETVATKCLLDDAYNMISIVNPLVARDGAVPYMVMNNREVCKFGLEVMKNIEQLLFDEQVFDLHRHYFIPHQANLRLLQKMMETGKFDANRFYTEGIETVGNLLNSSVFFGLRDVISSGWHELGNTPVALGAFGAEKQVGVAVLHPVNPENLLV